MSTSPPLEIGSVLGAYKLQSVLGVGGMGCVYRGVHVKLGRKAAIKVLSDSLARDPELVSRFFAEARVVSAVGHPNIIDIIDFIEIDEPRRVAYVMELIESPSLSAVLRSRKLTPRQAINLTLQLTDAARAVHAINVVHRDLKPDNLLVTGSLETDLSVRPSLKVLDFGIAKIQDPQSEHRTGTGMMMGTPAYMAPEQVAAEAVSPATDIYAIGEILYEMLTGQRMFAGQNMTILRAKIAEQPPPVVIPAEISESDRLASLIRACVAQSPADRPDLATVEAELLEALEDQPSLGDGPAPRRASSIARAPVVEATPPPAVAALATPMIQPTAAVQLPRAGMSKGMIAGAIACAAAVSLVALLALRSSSSDAPVVAQPLAEALPDPAPAPAPAPEPAPAVVPAPAPAPAPAVAPQPEAPPAAAPAPAEVKPTAKPAPKPTAKPTAKPAPKPAAQPATPAAEEASKGPLKKGEYPEW